MYFVCLTPQIFVHTVKRILSAMINFKTLKGHVICCKIYANASSCERNVIYFLQRYNHVTLPRMGYIYHNKSIV